MCTKHAHLHMVHLPGGESHHGCEQAVCREVCHHTGTISTCGSSSGLGGSGVGQVGGPT